MKKLAILAILAVLCSAPLFALGFEVGGSIGVSDDGFGLIVKSERRVNVSGYEASADFRLDLDGQLGIYAKAGYSYGSCMTLRVEGQTPRAQNVEAPMSVSVVDIDAGALYNFDFKSSKFGVAAGAGIDAALMAQTYEDEGVNIFCISLGVEALIEANYRVSDSLVLFCDVEPKLAIMTLRVLSEGTDLFFIPTAGLAIGLGARYAF